MHVNLKRLRSLRLMAATFVVGSLAACSSADFNSKDKKGGQSTKVAAACDADGHYPDKGRVTTDAEKIYLEGDFCPTAPAELRVVFLVDFSLSMHNKEKDRGNDKEVNGTCGRLKAAKAILEKHREQLQESGARMLVSAIGFSSGIDLTIPLTDIEEFESKENADTFCVGKGNTNYKAAFDAASEMLKDDDGTKVVYFISDGLPSMGGGGESGEHERHREAAETAAKDFRSAVSKMTFNAVYLGNELESASAVDPEEFLATITGDKARVKYVENPDALAESILKLEEPVIDLDPASVKGVFESGGKKVDVLVPVFEKLEDRKHVWRFYTKDIEPFKNGETSGTFTVYATDQKGEKYQVVFTIQKP
jgi:hypothetical protein